MRTSSTDALVMVHYRAVRERVVSSGRRTRPRAGRAAAAARHALTLLLLMAVVGYARGQPTGAPPFPTTAAAPSVPCATSS